MKKYIDADAAYEVLTEYYHHKTEAQHKALREALDRVPAADVVEVKHGHWVKRWNTWFKCDVPVCSVCGNGEIFKTDYCPECGAKMVKEDDDTD